MAEYLQSGLSCPVPHLFLPRAGQDIKNSQASVISRLFRTCNGLTSGNLLGECYLWLVSRRRGGGVSGKVIHWFGYVFQFSAHHSAAGEEELPRKVRRLQSRPAFPASLGKHRVSRAVTEGPGGVGNPHSGLDQLRDFSPRGHLPGAPAYPSARAAA